MYKRLCALDMKYEEGYPISRINKVSKDCFVHGEKVLYKHTRTFIYMHSKMA